MKRYLCVVFIVTGTLMLTADQQLVQVVSSDYALVKYLPGRLVRPFLHSGVYTLSICLKGVLYE